MRYRIIIFLFMSVLASCTEEKAIKEVSFSISDKMMENTVIDQAAIQPLKNELHFFGKITADNNKLIEVYPVVGGNVTKVYVELGDYVKKYQVLAEIRSTEIAGFEKDMEDAKNDVIVAKNNLKVAQELFEGKMNAERDVIEAKNMLEKSLSQLHRMEEVYKVYNVKGDAVYDVKSPLSGFVIQKNINQDMQLRNDRTDNIFDIAQINEVWAIANVTESDINQIKLGIDATVTTLSYPDKVFKGKVDKIFNVIDPETKTMKIRIKLHNADYLLKPEMRAVCKLSYYEDNKKMMAIPSSAIIFDKSKNFVLVYKSRSDIETRQVEIFRQVGDTTYLESGVNDGEKVITKNQLLIYNALNDN